MHTKLGKKKLHERMISNNYKKYYFNDRVFLNMWAVPSSAIFWTSFGHIFPGILSTVVSKSLERTPRAPTTTGITVVLSFHILCISISKSLYFDFFSNSFLETFLSAGTATSISIHSFFSLSLMMMSGLFAFIVLSVWILKSHKMVIRSF